MRKTKQKQLLPEVIIRPTSSASEQYRTISANISFSMKDKKFKTILVTSPEASAGKSTTITNVAAILASQGKKVLLLDCDLRKPSIHRKLNIPNNKGLSNIIANDVPIDECIQIKDQIPNLSIITSGPIPTNPSNLITSDKMDVIIKELKDSELFDIIMIDTPPTLVVSDSQTLASKVDASVIITKYNQTKKEELNLTIKALSNVKSNILGCIINEQPVSEHDYYYGA